MGLFEQAKPKQTSKTDGIVFVVEDDAYPKYIRVGYSTISMEQKMSFMNSNRPYKGTKIVYESDAFSDIKLKYNQLLGRITERAVNNNNNNRTLSSGWFSNNNKEMIEQVLAGWLTEQSQGN